MLKTSTTSASLRRAASLLAVAIVAPCVFVAQAWAARVCPDNRRQVKITHVADDEIVADGKAFHLAPGVLIYTQTNSTLVRGALPENVIARMQLDGNGDVRRVWILDDDEILVRPWWQFWRRDQPQSADRSP